MEELKQDIREIKRDLWELEEKWERQLAVTVNLVSRLEVLCSQVQILNRLLLEGNGQKSVMAQLAELQTSLVDLKAQAQSQVLVQNQKMSVEEEKAAVVKQRWVTVGKLVGLLGLAAPGILSLFGVGG